MEPFKLFLAGIYVKGALVWDGIFLFEVKLKNIYEKDRSYNRCLKTKDTRYITYFGNISVVYCFYIIFLIYLFSACLCV